MRHAIAVLVLAISLLIGAPPARAQAGPTGGTEYVIRTTDQARYRLTVRYPQDAPPDAVVWLFEVGDVGLIDAWRVAQGRSIWPARGVPAAVVSLVRIYDAPPANGPEADDRIIGAHIPADVALWTGTALEGRAEETAIALEEVASVFAERHSDLTDLPSTLFGQGYQATQVLWMAATRPDMFDIYIIRRAWLADETVGPVLAGLNPGAAEVWIAAGTDEGQMAHADRLAVALRDHGRTVIDVDLQPLLPLGVERPCVERGEC